MESSGRPARGRSSPTGWLLWHQWVKAVLDFFLILTNQQNTNVLVKQVLGYKVPKNDNFFFFI